MDAMTLLREVSEAYRGLQTLSLEALLSAESGDENSSQRSERRMYFAYAAPNRLRFEYRGRPGTLQISDGAKLHNCFVPPRGHPMGSAPRFTSAPLAKVGRLPHVFYPDLPFANGVEAFLFPAIAEHVAAAAIEREEAGCYVVSVTYESAPDAGSLLTGPPLEFWISAHHRMVTRFQGEMGIRHPFEDQASWTRHASVARNMRVNEPIPSETFHFTPPPDAAPPGETGSISVGGGGGFIRSVSDENRRLEHHGSYKWEGDTLVEHSHWTIREVSLSFERRLTFSEDGNELRVADRLTGPKGDAEATCTLPLA